MKKNIMSNTRKTYRKHKVCKTEFRILCFVLRVQKSQVHQMFSNASSRVQPLITREESYLYNSRTKKIS